MRTTERYVKRHAMVTGVITGLKITVKRLENPAGWPRREALYVTRVEGSLAGIRTGKSTVAWLMGLRYAKRCNFKK